MMLLQYQMPIPWTWSIKCYQNKSQPRNVSNILQKNGSWTSHNIAVWHNVSPSVSFYWLLQCKLHVDTFKGITLFIKIKISDTAINCKRYALICSPFQFVTDKAKCYLANLHAVNLNHWIGKWHRSNLLVCDIQYSVC